MINVGAIHGSLGFLMRKLAGLLPRKIYLPILQGPAKGKKWLRSSGVDGYWLGTYEPKVQEELLKHLKKDSVFYDIGAHAGYFSLLAERFCKKVYAFEPDTRNYENLLKNLLKNKSNINVNCFAISNIVGHVQFSESPNGFESKIVRNGGVSKVCQTIDNLVFNLKTTPPSIIKIDVEGHLNEVLDGAKRTIEMYHPTIIAEGRIEEVSRLLLKYHVVKVDENNVIAIWQ